MVIDATSSLSAAAVAEVQEQLGELPTPLDRLSPFAQGCSQLAVHTDRELIGLAPRLAGPASPIISVAGLGTASGEHATVLAQAGVRLYPDSASSALPAIDRLQSAISQLDNGTLIARTMDHCGDVPPARGPEAFGLLWVSKPSSLRDAIAFWNFRALLLDLDLLTPFAIVPPEVTTDGSFKAALHQALSRKSLTFPDVFLYSESLSESELLQIRGSLELEEFTEDTLSVGHRFKSDRSEPFTALTNIGIESWLQFVLPRVPGVRSTEMIQFERPSTHVRVASAVTWNPRWAGGVVVVRFSAPPELSAPSRAACGPLFHADATWAFGGLELRTMPLPVYGFDIRIPSGDAILRAALSETGTTFEPSDKGRIAQGLLGYPGALRLFESQTVLTVIGALRTDRFESNYRRLRKSLGKRTSEEAVRDAARQVGTRIQQTTRTLEGIASSAGGLDPSMLDRALSDLVEARLVLRGFRVECEVCGLHSFVELPEVQSRPSCPACESHTRYVGRDGKREPTLWYRLNALLDRAADQGLLGHLAAGAMLRRRGPHVHLVLGANVSRNGKPEPEADLLCLDRDLILAGEVKSNPADFTPHQIKRDVRLSRILGAGFHVMACLGEVPPDARALAEEECHRGGIRLLLADGPRLLQP